VRLQKRTISATRQHPQDTTQFPAGTGLLILPIWRILLHLMLPSGETTLEIAGDARRCTCGQRGADAADPLRGRLLQSAESLG
jgi:hypothetical protein